MKRSQNVVLSRLRKQIRPFALTPIATTVLTTVISGCDTSPNPNQADMFFSMDECTKANPGLEQECQYAYKTAIEEAAKTAPKYKSEADCKAEFSSSSCIQDNQSGFFMPMMAGFMLAKLVSPEYCKYNNNPYSNCYYSEPFFRYNSIGSSRVSWVRANGDLINSSVSSKQKTYTYLSAGDRMDKPSAVTKTISRGGFGSTVSARSSWSSSSSSDSGFSSHSSSSHSSYSHSSSSYHSSGFSFGG